VTTAQIMFISVALTLSLQVFAGENFPLRPDPQLTSGMLCDRPVEFRYPEHIAYCGRDVTTETKSEIFNNYRKIGYQLSSTDRADYKIDHFIPLCMGGANEKVNLWPQHISIYQITDSIEELLCEKMKQGKLSQVKAVLYMKGVKNDLTSAAWLLKTLKAL
jgi:hypothetical protein